MTLVNGMATLREALLGGKFDALEGVRQEIEDCLPQLSGMSKEELMALSRMAKENALRLEAARLGIRSARRRLAEIAAAECGLTYDRSGSKSGLSTATTGLRF